MINHIYMVAKVPDSKGFLGHKVDKLVLFKLKVLHNQKKVEKVPWFQDYDPAGRWLLSSLLAALPIIVLLGRLAFLRLKAHVAAVVGLLVICQAYVYPISLMVVK